MPLIPFIQFIKEDEDYSLKVEQKDDDEDCNYCGNMSAILYDSLGNELTTLALFSLWPNEEKECNIQEYYAKYNKGDFFQQAFRSTYPGQGDGSRLHDLLIKYSAELNASGLFIRNIYSTNPLEDIDLCLSPAAEAFWQKRVSKGKAEFVNSAGRHKIVWS